MTPHTPMPIRCLSMMACTLNRPLTHGYAGALKDYIVAEHSLAALLGMRMEHDTRYDIIKFPDPATRP